LGAIGFQRGNLRIAFCDEFIEVVDSLVGRLKLIMFLAGLATTDANGEKLSDYGGA
jgi:hypothetical protein